MMHAHAAVQERIDAAFRDAEAAGRLLKPGPRDAVALQRRARDGTFVCPAPRLYARANYWDALPLEDQVRHLVRGLAKQHPTWVFRSFTAALLWGLDVPHQLLDRVHIASNSPHHACDVVAAKRRSTIDTVQTVDGVRVTPLAQTVVDCLREAPFGAGLAIADSALRDTGATASDLHDWLAVRARCWGIRRARIVASYADGRAENGGESRVRAFAITHGFQLPELQVEFPDPTRRSGTIRVDFLWTVADNTHIVGEFDGMQKYRDPRMLQGKTTVDALIDERQRESRLTLLGLPVLCFTYQDLIHPERLVRLFESVGIPRDLDAAQRWRAAWRSCGGC